ncbi:MAG: transposase domain-containing protein, partial [Sedimenticolaceae bacterium]
MVRRDIADSLDTDTSNLAEERQHTTPGSSPGRATGTFCRHATHGTKKSRVTAPHSTLHSCRLHGVDPYTYLVDVLLRMDLHPARDI